MDIIPQGFRKMYLVKGRLVADIPEPKWPAGSTPAHLAMFKGLHQQALNHAEVWVRDPYAA